MRVIHHAVKRMRSQIGKVLLRQFAQGADHRLTGGDRILGKCVGLKFVPSRYIVDRGRKPESHEPAHQASEKESRRELSAGQTERGVEPGHPGEPSDLGKRPQLQERREGHELRDVAAPVMAYLVREHGLNLVRRKLLHKSIKEDDPAETAEARKEG